MRHNVERKITITFRRGRGYTHLPIRLFELDGRGRDGSQLLYSAEAELEESVFDSI